MSICIVEDFVLTAVIPIKNSTKDINFLKTTIHQSHIERVKLVLVSDGPVNLISNALQELFETVCKKCVLIVKKDFRNPGQARNEGIKNVNSEWIMFWDADDQPNIRNVVNSVRKNHGKQVIIGQYSYFRKYANQKSPKSSNSKLIQVSLNPGIWRIAMKREVILHGFPALRMGEDQVFLIENDVFGKEIKICNEEFYEYTIESDGQLTRDVTAIYELRFAIYRSIRAITRKPHWKLYLYLIMIGKLVYSLVVNCFRKANHFEQKALK